MDTLKQKQLESKNSNSKFYWLAVAYALYFSSIFTINSQLILLCTQLNIPTDHSYQITAGFNSLLFTLPVIGGYLGDKINKTIVVLSGFICSFFSLILLSLLKVNMLYAGISLAVVGNCLITPNLIFQVNNIYKHESSSLHDSNLVIFYLLMNIGAFAGSLSSGFIKSVTSYSYTFLFSSLLILASLSLYLAYSLRYSQLNIRAIKNLINSYKAILILFVIVSLSLLSFFLLKNEKLNHLFLWFFPLISLSYFFAFSINNKVSNRKKLFAFLLLCIISISFWSLYMLEPSMISLFTYKYVDRYLLGLEIPSSSFFSLNPLFIILLGIMFSYIWKKFNNLESSSIAPLKFSFAILLVGCGYLSLYLAATINSAQLINMFWLILYYGLLAAAELLIGPTGLAMSYKLSPKGYESRTIGVWQLFIGFSAMLSGRFGSLMNTSGYPSSRELYSERFLLIGLYAMGMAAISIPLCLWVSSLIKSERSRN